MPPGPPGIATPASAKLLTSTTASLSVLGSYTGYESDLTYTWSASGPAPVTFSANGTNAAKSTTATFTRSGTYTFTVDVNSSAQYFAASSVTYTVTQTFGLGVSPPSADLKGGKTQALTATVQDQFSVPRATQPAIAWAISPASGAGTLSGATGATITYTAPSAATSATVTASDAADGYSASSAITVVTTAPTVTASATPSPATGTTTSLSASATDPLGTSGMVYTWSVSGPAPVAFSVNGTNAAAATTATFGQTGNYTFTVVVADAAGQTASNTVAVAVNTTTKMFINPSTAIFASGTSYQYSVGYCDQFMAFLSPPQASVTWGTTNYIAKQPNGQPDAYSASISSSGLFQMNFSGSVLGCSSAIGASSSVAGGASATAYPGSGTSTTTTNPPSTPQGLTATPGPAQVTLSWSGVNNGTNAYTVYRSTQSGVGYTYLASASSSPYVDTAVTVGTTYYYVVTAKTSVGTSPYSNTASATPTYAPPVVTSAAFACPNPVIGQTTDLSVSGTNPGNGGALTYTWSASGPAPVTFSLNGTSAAYDTVATFTCAGDYTFIVALSNQGGLAVISTITVIVRQGAGTITAISPSSVSVAAGGAAQFMASGTDQFGNPLTSSTTVPWTVSGGGSISGGLFSSSGALGTYTVSVQGFSPTASVTVVTAPPTGLTATAGNQQVSLSWNAVSGASTYNVYRSSGGGALAKVGTSTTVAYTDTGLVNGTVYYYRVTAVVSGTETGTSNVATADPSGSPLAAPTLTAQEAGSTSATLTWSAVAGATGYSLYRGTTHGGEGTTAYQTLTGTSFSDTGLTASSTYYYQVAATGVSGPGPLSNEASVTAGTAPLPAPTGLTVTPNLTGALSIGLTWHAVSGASGYTVTRGAIGAVPALVATGTGTSFIDSALVYGQSATYSYTVAAFNAAGAGTTASGSTTPAMFSIFEAPMSVTVARGNVGAVNVNVGEVGGVSGPVTLSGAGLPSGVSAWFYPATVTPTPAPSSQFYANEGGVSGFFNGVATSGLFLAVSSGATPGTYTLTITGTQTGGTYGASHTNSSTVTLIVQ